MKNEHEKILIECFVRMRVLEKTPRPPDWKVWECDEYDELQVHGPAYAVGAWFPGVPNHERMRYRRAIDDLERAGLLFAFKRWGRRLSNVKLTEAGEKIARKLLKEKAK